MKTLTAVLCAYLGSTLIEPTAVIETSNIIENQSSLLQTNERSESAYKTNS
ncbi:MAG: hypothetical protein KatS3mg006_2066 [Pyrinomonadaceae bacterium]|jgi:hypothetical protein|nr:MAG: hypothetical protein KatS3mg006_2066 [Pyrinomonadaceae bacterium]